MFVVAMVIALAAVAVTAFVASRTATAEVTGAVERDIEDEEAIYEALSAFAVVKGSWDGVEELVGRLAVEYDERVALTTVDGDLIVDSAELAGVPEPLPDSPVGFIDPVSPVISFEEPFGGLESVEQLIGEFGEFAVAGEALADVLARVGVEFVVEGDDLGVPFPVWDEQDPFADAVVKQFFLGEGGFSSFGPLAPPDLVAALNDQAKDLAGHLAEAGVAHEVVEDPSGVLVVEWDLEDERSNEAVAGYYAALPPTELITGVLQGPLLETAPAALLFLGSDADPEVVVGGPGLPLLVAVGAVALLAVVVTGLASRRILGPIGDLTRAVRRMEEGDLSERVDAGGADEIGELAAAFNSMAASLEEQDRLRRTMTSDVAHELRTPLSNIRGYLEAMQEGVADPSAELIDSLHEEALHVQHLLDDLQYLSLAEAGELRITMDDVDLAGLAGRVVQAHQARAGAAGIELEIEAPASLHLQADAARLRQVVGNLLDNALRHTPAGGTVRVVVSSEEDAALLAVADTGSGIDAEHLPHVFDRFYRADSSRSRETGGSGLGLAIARELVRMHGGSIAVVSEPGEGTVFTVSLAKSG
jgi:two-component system sensor histidine kinase BaeS